MLGCMLDEEQFQGDRSIDPFNLLKCIDDVLHLLEIFIIRVDGDSKFC